MLLAAAAGWLLLLAAGCCLLPIEKARRRTSTGKRRSACKHICASPCSQVGQRSATLYPHKLAIDRANCFTYPNQLTGNSVTYPSFKSIRNECSVQPHARGIYPSSLGDETFKTRREPALSPTKRNIRTPSHEQPPGQATRSLDCEPEAPAQAAGQPSGAQKAPQGERAAN